MRYTATYPKSIKKRTISFEIGPFLLMANINMDNRGQGIAHPPRDHKMSVTITVNCAGLTDSTACAAAATL